jgi:hypothetical protein
MTKLIGIGGRTEAITKRNPTQRQLWVAVERFETEATALWVSGIPGYEALEKVIQDIEKEISKLQWEKWDKERVRAEIIALENRLADAYVDFAKGVMRISGKWIEIVRLLDPTLPASTTEADLQTKLADTVFLSGLRESAKTLTDASVADIAAKLDEASSVDFSTLFASLKQFHIRYQTEKPKLQQIEKDIEKLTEDITKKNTDRANKTGIKSKLEPLYEEMKKLDKKGLITTVLSRFANATAGALLLATISAGSGAMKQNAPTLPTISPVISAPNNQNTTIVSWHTIVNNNGVFEIMPANNATLKSPDGSEFQFNTTTRTFNYKLAWGAWVDNIQLGFTGNVGVINTWGKNYKVTFSPNRIDVVLQ